MIKVGITGSIASGKTTIVKIFKKKKFKVFSADQEVRKIYKKKIFLKTIRKKFQINKSQNIRNQIKKAITGNKKNLLKLEKIIHPLVRKEMIKISRNKRLKNNYVFEVPLLAESKLKSHFTKTIFVASKKEIRIKRYKKKGGSINLFRFLDGRQLSPKAKAKYCDYKIVNNGSKNLLNKKVLNIIKLL